MTVEELFSTITFDNPALMPNNAVTISLTVLSGLLWTVAYVGIIKRGFKDKTSGMPLLVLGLNLAWEFCYAFVFTMQIPTQRVVNAIWFLFDIGIVYLKFKYGRDEFNSSLPGFKQSLFYPYLIVIMIFSFGVVFTARYEWNDLQGAYSAYLQNVFISSLFIPMLFRKGSTAGQSMSIAICKCAGTLAPDMAGAYAIVTYIQANMHCSVKEAFLLALDIRLHPMMKILIVMCFFFDVIYIVCLYKKFKEEGLNPWTRKPLADT